MAPQVAVSPRAAHLAQPGTVIAGIDLARAEMVCAACGAELLIVDPPFDGAGLVAVLGKPGADVDVDRIDGAGPGGTSDRLAKARRYLRSRGNTSPRMSTDNTPDVGSCKTAPCGTTSQSSRDESQVEGSSPGGARPVSIREI